MILGYRDPTTNKALHISNETNLKEQTKTSDCTLNHCFVIDFETFSCKSLLVEYPGCT